jgi:hypothetical protein
MSRYTLKTFYGTRQLEVFEHRSPGKIAIILSHPRHHRAGETGPWGETLENVDRVEIADNHRERIFQGSVNDCMKFLKTLK